jgi:hypothetical protein
MRCHVPSALATTRFCNPQKKMPALRANAELFKAARRKHVSDVKSEGGEKYDWRTGGLRVYVKWSVDDDAAPDAIPPGHGHYEEQDDGRQFAPGWHVVMGATCPWLMRS